MESTVINILESAKKIGAKSVAMPAISAGMQGFPLERSSNIIIDQCIQWSLLQKYLENQEGEQMNSIQKIKLMSWLKDDVDIFKH